MKVVIIGGVAGGASAAARLRRMDENAEIVLIEKSAYISYANCGLPYYIGGVIHDRQKLFVQTPSSFRQRFQIDARISSEVIRIDRDRKSVLIKNLNSEETYEEHYDKLILSPGAEPIRPPLPGLQLPGVFTLRNVADTDAIKKFTEGKSNAKAVVIGAGFIGLEMAENLHHLGMHVSVVEMASQILAPVDFAIAAIAQQHLRHKGLDLYLNTSMTGIRQEDSHLFVDLKEKESLEADIVILSIGVRADTQLAQSSGLELGPTKAIKVNEYLQTSDPDIYALGDAIEFDHPILHKSMPTYLAGPANKQGRIVADNIIFGNQSKYKGAIGTAIVKLFDLTIATSGVASKHLKIAQVPHIVSTTHSASHATYYPGSHLMSIQLAVSQLDGRLLGAQAIGVQGVDKRIDVLATAVQRGASIEELTEFEHAYAPPYSSAKDPVNMAAFVAQNRLTGKSKAITWDELKLRPNESQLVDVRTRAEFEKGHIPQALHIPIDELRDRISELDPNKPVIVYCQVGLRGYLSERILRQRGFTDVINLAGGYYSWSFCDKELQIT
ncbi:MAG: FAD-dependent oxidoreductase [Saprospiraceae bacterium]|nr:FAD-dependent oxidoreductase [Saprospiraceae bacterium]